VILLAAVGEVEGEVARCQLLGVHLVVVLDRDDVHDIGAIGRW
jgi:hypothetical protein